MVLKHVNGGACSVSLSASLLHSECWTRSVLHARVEIFKPGGQRSAVYCCQAQTEVDQSLSGRFLYLLLRKCGRVPFSSPFSLSLFIHSASVSQIFRLSVIVNHRCETHSQEVSKRENERARSCTFTFLQSNKTQDLCLSFCLSSGMSQHLIAKPEFSHWKWLQYIFVLTGDSFHWEYVGNMQTCGAGDLDYSIFQAKGR